jgi:hypothetical protein
MLEGLFNLFQFEIQPATSLPRLSKLNPNYFAGKMGDNSRGAVPLSMILR